MSRTVAVRNPRTGKEDYSFDAPDADELAGTAGALRASQPAWSAMGAEERGAVLIAWAESLKKNDQGLLKALIQDTGRTAIAKAEVMGFLTRIEGWAKSAPGMMTTEARRSNFFDTIRLESRNDPYPLVGVISPWNFPLLLSFIDALPALMAGCAVIIKPSEVTPRFAEPIMKSLKQHPTLASVLKVVAGDGQTGAALTPLVDAVAFTGSVKTGRLVGEAAAANFIPAFLELGGKDPAIILEDADIDRAADALLRGSIAATGQACQSIERIYVHHTIAEEFTTKLAQKAEEVSLSWPDADSGIVGPLIFGRQADIIADHLADARSKGARILTGGKMEELGGGDFIAPTVLDNVTHEMKVMTEETFGPVMPVMSFKDDDEAIKLANDSLYGLSACVFSESVDRACAVADKINAGGISINDAGLTTMVHEIEKNGYGFSGIGASRMGSTGLLRFFRRKAYYIQEGDPSPVAALAEAKGPVQSGELPRQNPLKKLFRR